MVRGTEGYQISDQGRVKNHKGRISAVRDGKETTVPINQATKKEIAAERKKWGLFKLKCFCHC